MKQLELRDYPRTEIAEVLSVNLNDRRHFKRNVENKLSKWGYDYEYTTQAVKITSKPETPSERLAELVYRCIGMDVQVSALHFAYFIAAFTDIEGFATMPWAVKATEYYKRYETSVDERTMRGWCHQLIQKGIISPDGEKVAWMTTLDSTGKHREKVMEGYECDAIEYFKRRSEIFAEEYKWNLEKGIPPEEVRTQEQKQAWAKKHAWQDTYKTLWEEYGCCYYYCKCFTLGAFGDGASHDELLEICELSHELADEAVAYNIERHKPRTPKEEFDLWFNTSR